MSRLLFEYCKKHQKMGGCQNPGTIPGEPAATRSRVDDASLGRLWLPYKATEIAFGSHSPGLFGSQGRRSRKPCSKCRTRRWQREGTNTQKNKKTKRNSVPCFPFVLCPNQAILPGFATSQKIQASSCWLKLRTRARFGVVLLGSQKENQHSWLLV